MNAKTIDRNNLTPMMQHYISIKEQYPDCIIMYRLGDFYEIFFDDAEEASQILELALTGRNCGLDERAPMCGVPHHVVDSYINKLVSAGKKVAVVDQMEDPAQAQGLVQRAITRVITPGTITDSDALHFKENNYILAIKPYQNRLGIAYSDLSTGEFAISESIQAEDLLSSMQDWIVTLHPSEIVYLSEDAASIREYTEKRGIFFTHLDKPPDTMEQMLNRVMSYIPSVTRSTFKNRLLALSASDALLTYIYQFQKENLVHINQIQWIDTKRYLRLNASTRDNLEIQYNINDKSKKNTLFSVLDKTKTAMGSRLLNHWLDFPLLEEEKINQRYDQIDAFLSHFVSFEKAREALGKVYDLERLLSKLSFQRANARDLLSLGYSLEYMPTIANTLEETSDPNLTSFIPHLLGLEALAQEIKDAIREDAPISTMEGGLIKEGYSEDLDHFKYDSIKAKEQLVEYEQAQREETGIKNLRVEYKKNVGYFIEITNSHLQKIPSYYQRRQTLKNAERFVTAELENISARITNDEQKIFQMEYQLFQQLREKIAKQAMKIQDVAMNIAYLDVICALAQAARDYHYVRPKVIHSGEIIILGGRHPVVEQTSRETFIPNDLVIGDPSNRIQIITGPNMAGKSTYMRQNALILLMAQIGSFVPAERCEYTVVDQIFTRIGANDNLASGDSTFMVEMKEMASIIQNATVHSFLVLDEVGRGTSTDDGLSIAQAIIEFLSKNVNANTLFATHYHELTEMEEYIPSITNHKLDIQEYEGQLVFLRKVIPGKADKSYGIEVARLSGLPEEILTRANAILQALTSQNAELGRDTALEQTQNPSASFQEDFLRQELAEIDMNRITPLEAFQKLNDLVNQVKKRESK